MQEKIRNLVITPSLLTVAIVSGCLAEQDYGSKLSLEDVRAQLAMEQEIIGTTSILEMDQYIEKAAGVFSKVVANRTDLVNQISQSAQQRSVMGMGAEVLVSDLLKVLAARSESSSMEMVSILESQQPIIDALESVPHFQLELMNLDLLEEGNPIWFAAMQYSIDDRDLVTITAYDGNGNSRQMTREEVNSEPVIIVGINEKMNLLEHSLSYDEEGATASGSDNRSLPDTVFVTEMNIHDNSEWGNAEIYHFYAAGYFVYKFGSDLNIFKDVNGEKTYPLNTKIGEFEYRACNKKSFDLEFWEADFGGVNMTRTLSKYENDCLRAENNFSGSQVEWGDDLMWRRAELFTPPTGRKEWIMGSSQTDKNYMTVTFVTQTY